MKCADCGLAPAAHPAQPQDQWPYMWLRDDVIRCGPCMLGALMRERLIIRLDPARLDDVALANNRRLARETDT